MKIKSVNKLENISGKYVYDIESNDQNQTFYANGILVHNSNYVTFKEIKNNCDWDIGYIWGYKKDKETDKMKWIKVSPKLYKKDDMSKIIKELSLDIIYDKFEFRIDGKELIKQIYEFRLAGYLDNKFNEYAEKYSTENFQNFELETICEQAIFLQKKKYVYNPTYSVTGVKKLENGDYKLDGIDIESLSSIKAKGVEIVQSSTPLFARKHLKDLIRYIFENATNFNLSDFVKILRKLKEEFILTDIHDISFGVKIGDYHKYILNDTTEFETAKGALLHIKSAGYYNWMLNNTASNYKKKYSLITTDTKIKYYLVKTRKDNFKAFGYLPNMFPYEFAPEIDFDKQFYKAIINPINRFVKVMGYKEIDKGLKILTSLF